MRRVGKTPETVGEMSPKERKAAVRQKRRAEGKTPKAGKGNKPTMTSHKQIEEASCPRNPRGTAEDTWVAVKNGRVNFYIGSCTQPYQTFGDGDAVQAIRYGEEVYVTLRNGKIQIYRIMNGRSVYGPVRSM